MTDLQQRLTNRLELVREDLNEAIGRLGSFDMNWAPREGMRTVGGQLKEIAVTEHQIYTWLATGHQVSYKELDQLFERATLAEYIELLDQTREDTMVYLRSKTDEELRTPIKMPEGWFESLKMAEVPPSEVIRSIAQHEWYHTGQLVSYLWMHGDDPYEW